MWTARLCDYIVVVVVVVVKERRKTEHYGVL
jgi:hypothetical protein